jgi:hypothetical protein
VGTRERMAGKASDWLATRLQRVPPADLERFSRRLLDVVDDVSRNRWDAAQARAAAAAGVIRPERIDAVTGAFVRELTAAGATAGAAAAAPMVGAMGTLAATMAELVWFTGRAGDLILTIAALHGHPEPSVDERRAWVLAVLIYGSSARDELARALNEASTGLAPASPDRRIALTTLQSANRMMSRVLMRRYGTRRGAIAIGRALPIGFGAVIGGSANFVAIRTLARNADAFFAQMPYSAIDATSTDITGRQLG